MLLVLLLYACRQSFPAVNKCEQLSTKLWKPAKPSCASRPKHKTNSPKLTNKRTRPTQNHTCQATTKSTTASNQQTNKQMNCCVVAQSHVSCLGLAGWPGAWDLRQGRRDPETTQLLWPGIACGLISGPACLGLWSGAGCLGPCPGNLERAAPPPPEKGGPAPLRHQS